MTKESPSTDAAAHSPAALRDAVRSLFERAAALRGGVFRALRLAGETLRTLTRGKGTAPSAVESVPTPEPVIEPTVGDILGELGEDHLVLRRVRCQFGVIDYVVLSRQHGVFLVEVKGESGRVAVVDSKVRVNGKLPEEDVIAKTLRHTYWLVEELRAICAAEPCVTPLLLFSEATVENARPLKGVTILGRKQLAETLHSGGQPLPAAVWAARGGIAEFFTGMVAA